MEIALNKDVVTSMEFIGRIEDDFNAESESIIPDSMPDAEDIRDACGTLLVKKAGIDAGRCVIEGSVTARVAYCPDGRGGLRTVCVKIPFINYTDAPNAPEDAKVVATARIVGINAGLINARKIAVSAKIAVEFDVYAPARMEYCRSAENPEKDLQVDCLDMTMMMPYSCGEKIAELSEDIEIGAGKPPVGEIVRFCVNIKAKEIRPITNKVLVKAALETKIAYTSPADEELHIVESEVPFSQVIEVDGVEENSVCRAEFTLCDLMTEPVENISGEMRYVAIDAKIRTEIVCYRNSSICPVRDMYCVSDDMVKTSVKTYNLIVVREEIKQQVAIKDTLEIKDNISKVYDLRTELGMMSSNTDGSSVELNAEILAVITYQNMDGEIKTVRKILRISHPIQLPAKTVAYNVKIAVSGESFTIDGVDSAEIRMIADISYMVMDMVEVNSIVEAERIKADGEVKKQPSLIMCFTEKDDRLWEIAKKYKTTVEDIIAANRIENSERAPSGKMLIIPRKSV